MSEKEIEFYVPDVIFKTRVKNKETDSFEWKDVSCREMFKNKKSLLVVYCMHIHTYLHIKTITRF